MRSLGKAFHWVPLVLAACLAGCNTGGEDAGGGLAAGHYLIQGDQDDFYAYAQYFVVLPGSRWEFVEYGTRADGTVCQVTRHRGTYSLKDSTLNVVGLAGGESLEGCPITQADFDGYAWEAAPPGAAESFRIRNPTDSSFQALDLFVGVTGWRTYTRGPDPHGYYD